MEPASFDFDVFAISVASRLLGSHCIQENLTNASNEEVHRYWRSRLSETQCAWMDSSWELKCGQVVWKLGGLWKNATGGVYVQSDELKESDFRQFFKSRLSIDLESSPTSVLAETFARALQDPHSSSCDKGSTDCKSIYLHFSDLEMTVAFTLASDTTGTLTEVSPVILERLQFTNSIVTTQSNSATLTNDQLLGMFQSWKSQFASSSGKDQVLSPSITDEKSVSSLEEKPSNHSKKVANAKRSRVHGYSKVTSQSRRKPGLKFKD